MTLDELLNTKQLNYYINIAECNFFGNKVRDAEELRIVFQSELSEYLYLGQIGARTVECFDPNNSDAYMTALQGNVLKNIILLNKQKVNPSLLTLYLGGLSQKYLSWILDAEAGKLKNRHEFCYSDGEIVVADVKKITTNNPEVSIDEIKSRLAEGVLISANQFANLRKPLSKSGTYVERGISQKQVRESFDSESLKKFAKSKEVISSLNPDKFSEYIKSGLIKKWDVIKYIDKQMLPADIAVNLMEEGIFTKEDVYSKVLHIKNDKDLATLDKISFSSKLLLYSYGRMKISDLEKAAKYEEKRNNLSITKKDIKRISKYYKGNLNKISELLTHNVLDFTLSMDFLNELVSENCINVEDKNYLVNIMNDFKTNELLNKTENEKFTSNNIVPTKPKIHTNGVTIDPKLRKQYFESIGDVKEIFINGERLISDESEGVTAKNSLDGYQLIIIPDKKIAILEKFYEVKRNKEGKLEYKTDKKGNYIAATEQATYIMPIAMAKDFAEKKNKQQLKKSPYVARTLHSMNWITNTEDAMKKIAQRANLDVEFDKENTDKWAKIVLENYKKLRTMRESNIDELI